MTLVLDAGALLAVERGDREVIALLKGQLRARKVARTHGGVVAQVWRGGARQARLAGLLAALEIKGLDGELGRRAGELLGRTRTADVIDAGIALLAFDGDWILTSDPSDISTLVAALGVHAEIVRV